MNEQLRVGIVGAAGYTGAELVRILHAHPRLSLQWVAAASNAGKRLDEVLPGTTGVAGLGDKVLEVFDESDAPKVAKRLDVVFSALPHAASARVCGAFYDAGVQVVDLSADFRFSSLATYESWYGKHPRPELLEHAVYGLPEMHRAELEGARLIAAPGCYVTSATLPLAPLLAEGLIEAQGIIVDAKSGVSGAGRTPKPSTHLPESAEGMRPYSVAGSHRHTPEIEQELSRAAGKDVVITFTPHLAPMTRGIFTCAYGRATAAATADDCRRAAQARFAGGVVTVLDAGRLPDTLWVRGSARAHVAYALDERTGTVLAMCALDNLAKGASSQAVQALNVARGWPDDTGLPTLGLFP